MFLREVLRRARMAAGLTQEALAQTAGVDRTYVNMLEQDRRRPSVKVFVDLCAALDVGAGEVLSTAEAWIAKSPRSSRGRQARSPRKRS